LPVTVAVDLSRAASPLVRRELAGRYDVVVIDYVHAAIFKPAECPTPSVCLTHNVEAEILARHAAAAGHAIMRLLWRSQHRKMRRFERAALTEFDVVVAISERDARLFRDEYGLSRVATIPTGVDLDYFQFSAPAGSVAAEPLVAFTGSMDSRANVNGVEWFIDRVWPRIAAAQPRARCVIVGKNPPESLVVRARSAARNIEFTGFVDDVRPHMRSADVSVIPLLVGGGTRIKAYEAMAMGIPIVSTTLGVEGLPLCHGKHLLVADEAEAFADRVVELIANPALRGAIAESARRLVEENFGAARVAQIFERICLDAAMRHPTAASL
jgi:glycosyltransferase involved in cell wall biosynthesis